MTGNSAGHAEPGVCVYVRRPNEALHQLVGDIIILRQQLAGNIEGHTVRPVTGNSVGKALGHLTDRPVPAYAPRSEEHTSELQSLMRISYAVFCLTKKNTPHTTHTTTQHNKTHRQHQAHQRAHA